MLANQLAAFNGPSKSPQQRTRRSFRDAAVGIRSNFIRKRGHLRRWRFAEYNRRFVVPTAAHALNQLERIEHARLVADKHRVEYFVAQMRQPGRHADRLNEHDFGGAITPKRL